MAEAAGAAKGSGKRLAIAGPSASAILRLRDGVIREAVRRRHRVLAIAPDAGDDAHAAAFTRLGAESRAVELEPPGLAFLANRKAEAQLTQLMREWRPDAVLGFGSRAMVLAALAGRGASVPRIVCMVSALPRDGLSGGADANGMAARHYARAFKACDAVIVHNGDDARRLAQRGVLPRGLALVHVPGAGVDLERHAAQPLPSLAGGLVFLMISRLERPRGVGEFVAAARLVTANAPGARFVLVAEPGRGSDAVTAEALKAGEAVQLIGPLDDVRAEIGRAHVYVYPSHAEGMPRSVLEALAAGRPVITTDVPGCRETVDERVNGCLVPAGDAEALAAAIQSFLRRPDLIPAMCRASRAKAERGFDVREVNDAVLAALGL